MNSPFRAARQIINRFEYNARRGGGPIPHCCWGALLLASTGCSFCRFQFLRTQVITLLSCFLATGPLHTTIVAPTSPTDRYHGFRSFTLGGLAERLGIPANTTKRERRGGSKKEQAACWRNFEISPPKGATLEGLREGKSLQQRAPAMQGGTRRHPASVTPSLLLSRHRATSSERAY